jgi:hypothetical protein
MDELNALTASGDFEGAEELLCQSLGQSERLDPFVHFQFGRLYARWNKLTSATNHLCRAVELAQAASDELLSNQILEELKTVRQSQVAQRP